MIKFATIQELYDEIRAGNIDESKLEIVLDNDCTSFGIVANDPDDAPTNIIVREANGHDDIEPLYKLLFPKAKVQWC